MRETPFSLDVNVNMPSTEMFFKLKDATADILAKRRRHNDLSDLPLDLISSEREVYDIQTAQAGLGIERKRSAFAPVKRRAFKQTVLAGSPRRL